MEDRGRVLGQDEKFLPKSKFKKIRRDKEDCCSMDVDEFRKRGREMIDYVADYLDTIEKRRVTPSVEPGYLKELIPLEAPEEPESWESIMADVESKIMPGMTHWQHPRFHAYFPSGNSYPSILADIIGDAIGCIGFSWAAGPACTELETIVLDWFAKMMGLPSAFLSGNEGSMGGGVIQTSASECVLVALLAARAQAIKKLKKQDPNAEEGHLLAKLMAYCSKEAHSCLEKGAMIAFVKLRILEPDENFGLRGHCLQKAMEEDIQNGMLPFFVATTIGTTSCCSWDNIKEIGPICEQFDVWLHCDAAYAGSAMICPEFRHLFEGIELATSLNTNTNKFLLVNFDCSCMWVKDRIKLTQALVVDPLYLQHAHQGTSIDYRHWGIPLSRRFRSLKLWFVIRTYGVEGLRKYIREHCRLAKYFEELVKKDPKFEIMNNVQFGLVCFRLKGGRNANELNQKLLSTINASGKLHMVPASLNDKYVIRFCVCREKALEADMEYAWKVIQETAAEVAQLLDEDCQLAKDKLEKEAEDEEAREKISELSEEQKKANLQYKRSFFVRMVSDPKIYNPKIVRNRWLPAVKAAAASQKISPEGNFEGNLNNGGNSNTLNIPKQHTPPTLHHQITPKEPSRASWISWPLAFMLQDFVEEVSNSEVPFRFRNWESTLTIKPGASGASTPYKTSPTEDSTSGSSAGGGLRPVSPNPGCSSGAAARARSKSPRPAIRDKPANSNN